MATFLKGEKNFYPEIKSFTPDYKFLSATLDARESKYLSGWEAANDTYSRMYSDLSQEENRQFQKQFIEDLTPKLQKISGLDFSIQQNVNAAKGVFAPFFEDERVVKDIVYTSTYKDQLRYASQLANSADFEVRQKFNPIAMEAMQFRMQEFQEADRAATLGMALPKFVEDADLVRTAKEYLKEKGLTMTVEYPSFGDKDGKGAGNFLITDKNGKLIEGLARNMIMTDLLDDPRVRQWYDTRTYVESMRFANNALEAGGVQSKQEGLQLWASEQLKVLEEINFNQQEDLKKDIDKRRNATVTWESVRGSSGLLPAEKTIVENNKSAVEQLQADLDRKLQGSEFLSMKDVDNTASLSKAYAMLGQQYMMQDTMEAARQYAYLDSSTDLEVNDLRQDELNHKYELNEIKTRAYFESEQSKQDYEEAFKLSQQEYEEDVALKQLQGAIDKDNKDDSSNDTERNRNRSTVTYGNTTSSIFQLDDDGLIIKDNYINENQNAIANKQKEMMLRKNDLIIDMFAARYPGAETYTINTGTVDEPVMEEMNSNRLREFLAAKQKVYNPKTQQEEETDKLKNYATIDRLFTEMSDYFSPDNEQNIYQEHPNWLIGDDGVRNTDDDNQTDYRKIQNKLFKSDPTNPSQQGFFEDEKLFNQMVVKNGEAFYSNATAASAALQETDKDFNKMINELNYPTPYVNENGIKRVMTKVEYMKVFRDMALKGEIKNFDGEGFGQTSDGDSNPNWYDKQITPMPSGIPGGLPVMTIMDRPDEDAIKGKSEYIYDKLTKQMQKNFGSQDYKTYLQIQREVIGLPGTNMGFTQTESVYTDGAPLPGSDSERVVNTMMNQFRQTYADPSQIGGIIMQLPEKVEDITDININAPNTTSDEAIAGRVLFNELVLKGADVKSKYKIEYFQNIGPDRFDDEGIKISTPMAGYKISEIDSEFITALNPDENKNSPLNAEQYDIAKDMNKEGFVFLFPRDKDISPGSYAKSAEGSNIKKRLDLSQNGTFKYTIPGQIFSPGNVIFKEIVPGKIQVTMNINTYDPASNDSAKQYKTQQVVQNIIYDPGENYTIGLNEKYNNIKQALELTNANNNLKMYDMRAKDLSKVKWIEGFKANNPGMSEAEYELQYQQALDFAKINSKTNE